MAKKKELDSNKLHSDIKKVCMECGISANVLTCLYRYAAPPKQLSFTVSTMHTGVCNWCGKEKSITQVRDFFYPDFNLLFNAQKASKKRKR